jgi:hypothetical protein
MYPFNPYAQFKTEYISNINVSLAIISRPPHMDVIFCMASRSAPVTGAFPPFGGPLPFGALPSAIDVLGDERREIRAILTF